MFGNAFQNKKVLVTGHTGFKGSWLCLWLKELGAQVYGYALEPDSQSLYKEADLENILDESIIADIANIELLSQTFTRIEPDFVFHLAAQPLVRYSYGEPIETFRTNVLGTVHVLDCLRTAAKPTTALFITTDKSYSNQEWLYSYRENDRWGGHDPYSASKGAAELVIDSYLNSYFSSESSLVRIAAVRAGNVIGGGDWAQDRIIPDCIKAIRQNEPIAVRNKIATRPWQHVLEPLSGYLQLAQVLAQECDLKAPLSDYMQGFNFGPELKSNRTVEQLVVELLQHTGGEWQDASDPLALHEASKLNLAIDKAFHLLSWVPVWNFKTTIEKTALWYQSTHAGESALAISKSQIDSYTQDASMAHLPWTQ